MGSFSARWGIALLAIVAVTLWASAGKAVTILVPGGQPTIQAGVDVAAAGDLVLVSPGNEELCDGIDDDCDGLIDEPSVFEDSTVYHLGDDSPRF